MRKVVILAALAAFATVSCSKYGETVGTASPIQFLIRDRQGDMSVTKAIVPSYNIVSEDGAACLDVCVSGISETLTKGSPATAANLEKFGAWARKSDGSEYFYDVVFRKDATDMTFGSSPVYYWLNNSPLDLYCYYPTSVEMATCGYELSKPGTVPTVTCETCGDASVHKDLVLAHITASGGSPELQMHHAMSCIVFKVGSYIPVGTKIKSINIRRIYSDGIISIEAPENGWTLDPNAYASAFFSTEEDHEWAMTENNKRGDVIGTCFFLLPQNLPEDSDIQIILKNDDVFVPFVFPLKDHFWNMGVSYSFYINIQQQ